MIIIKQKKRFRKDLGDLTELKNSIKEIGLIHPIVKDSQGNLIAGARRLQACIELGIEPIYRIVDFTNPEKAEIDENTQRKDFSPSEKVEIKKWVNKELAKKGNQYIKKCSVQNLDKALKVKERPIDIAAKITNTSTETLNKLDKIFSSDNEEIKRKVDNNTISVDKGIQELTGRKKRKVKRKRSITNYW
jgi:ParB/RepB/Spo0J family partition protein